MKRFSIFILTAITIIYADLPEFAPGQLILALAPEAETICYTSQDGFMTGISEVDAMLSDALSGEYIVPWRKMTIDTRDRVYFMRNFYLVYLPLDADIKGLCRQLKQLDIVEHAEPNYIMKNTSTSTDDPLAWQQWYVRRIQAHWVWDFQRGSADVVASVFEGLDWAHPDLAELIWQNLGEDADGDGRTMEMTGGEWFFDPDDLNCVDDDGDGYIDDLIGWDFMDGLSGTASIPEDEDVDTPDLDPWDEIGLGHGTHCTGTIGAMTDNGIGIAGINWHTKLAALRTDFTYNTGGGGIHGAHMTDAVMEAMAYCLIHDISVWSLSYGSNSYSGLMQSVLENAYDSSNVVIAAGAGNDNSAERFYPAAYDKVISVAATTDSDTRSGFSNFGTWVDICAPGSVIFSTFPRHSSDGFGYRNNSGTSMATPVVAGVLALLRSEYPDSTNDFYYDRVLSYTDSIPDEWYRDGALGSGRVNAYKALYGDIYPLLSITELSISGEDDGDTLFSIGENVDVHIELYNSIDWAEARDVRMYVSVSDPDIALSETLHTAMSIAPGGSIDWELSFVAGEGFAAGRNVDFALRVETASGYFLEEQMEIYIGTPLVLIYDRDGGEGAQSYIESDLQMGNVPFYTWDYSARGAIDPDFLNQNFRYIIFEGGANSEEPITEPEIAIFEGFLDSGTEAEPKGLFLSGQYLADSPLITDFLAEYMATQHISDNVSALLGLTVQGFAEDPITGGLELNVAYGSACSGPQTSIGSCIPIADGIPALFYFGTDDLSCATRRDAGHYRTFFAEWSLSGVSGDHPGRSDRFQLVYRVLSWFGEEFTEISESPATPEALTLCTYPNPFNSTLQITAPDGARVTIHDTQGRTVADIGMKRLWNAGDDVTSGVYVVRAKVGDIVLHGKTVLIR